jgi:hypothetical protein
MLLLYVIQEINPNTLAPLRLDSRSRDYTPRSPATPGQISDPGDALDEDER